MVFFILSTLVLQWVVLHSEMETLDREVLW